METYFTTFNYLSTPSRMPVAVPAPCGRPPRLQGLWRPLQGPAGIPSRRLPEGQAAPAAHGVTDFRCGSRRWLNPVNGLSFAQRRQLSPFWCAE